VATIFATVDGVQRRCILGFTQPAALSARAMQRAPSPSARRRIMRRRIRCSTSCSTRRDRSPATAVTDAGWASLLNPNGIRPDRTRPSRASCPIASLVRSPISLRSIWARPARIVAVNSPMAVRVSRASDIEIKRQPSRCASSMRSSRSLVLRPSRSSFRTAIPSASPRRTAASARARPGRRSVAKHQRGRVRNA